RGVSFRRVLPARRRHRRSERRAAEVAAVTRAVERPTQPHFENGMPVEGGGGGRASQMRAVRAELAGRRRVPSGLNTTHRTQVVCPFRASTSTPVRASHSRVVPSLLAVTTRLPSGLNPTDRTQLVCPFSVSNSTPVAASQIRAVWSSPAV